MHEVEGLIARRDKLAAGAGKFKGAILCPLVQDFALLPITDDLVRELKAYNADTKPALARPIEHISDGLHALAIDVSHNGPVAYVNTYYFGGRGGQDALVWDKGSLRFSPASPGYEQNWPNSPISQALRIIGVVVEQGMDEFDTVGLGKHRETHRWAKSAR